ncbi:MATE family efflux transporter [uncultured Methanobrevibacter sp.]|uniref:MATE family efflux transporter n=1 Tax=uncultured Methanobrevibacter sp. TaxID=253161 RepID=UPI0025F4F24D|nr:MATE family efflux transporter [uncultured Methanobrevibacter sp.]
MERRYDILKNKYNELLWPTLFTIISGSLCGLMDMIVTGFLSNSTQLSVLFLGSPLKYITGIFYTLLGQGCSLLALRAKSNLDHEKTNFYFTIAIGGTLLISIIILLTVFFFTDNILTMLNTPAEIFNDSRGYLLILMFFYPLNCYIMVISFFIRSDGFPKIPFYTALIANILNVIFDVIFMKGFNMGINGNALASVLGYLIGSIYISKYIFNENATYKLISLAKFKIREIITSFKEILLNTPEVVGSICFSIKTLVLTYLCSTYWGTAGLLAFLVYDNSETFIYMFLSGIMKTMSPIVTVLYKEIDYKAVQYIIKHSIKQVVIFSLPISIIFFLYPEILLKIFNIVDPQYFEPVTLAIRITAFSLIGRCLSYLLANYAQAIERNRIASIITFFEEFLFAVFGALILTRMLGGIGIWISILASEILPLLIFMIYSIHLRKDSENENMTILMLQDSNLITWTFRRELLKSDEKDLNEKNEKILANVEKVFKKDTPYISKAIEEICMNIFENNKDVDEIDITIRLIEDYMMIMITDDGELYNPIQNKKLIKSDNIKRLSCLNYELDYDEILGFNKTYLKIRN